MDNQTMLNEVQELLSEEECDLISPVTLDKIRKFEETHSVSLPEEYVSFLLNIAAGGEIRSLGAIISFNELVFDTSRLTKPFPHTEGWNWLLDGYDIDTIDKSSGSKYDTISDGTLTLFDVGCGESWFLVVTGKCRGEMWQKCEFGIQPTDKRWGFLEWLSCYLKNIPFWG